MLLSVTQKSHTAELSRVFICKWITTIVGRAGRNVHHERVVDRTLNARTRNNAEPHLARVAIVKAHECHFTFVHQNPLQVWYLENARCWHSDNVRGSRYIAPATSHAIMSASYWAKHSASSASLTLRAAMSRTSPADESSEYPNGDASPSGVPPSPKLVANGLSLTERLLSAVAILPSGSTSPGFALKIAGPSSADSFAHDGEARSK